MFNSQVRNILVIVWNSLHKYLQLNKLVKFVLSLFILKTRLKTDKLLRHNFALENFMNTRKSNRAGTENASQYKSIDQFIQGKLLLSVICTSVSKFVFELSIFIVHIFLEWYLFVQSRTQRVVILLTEFFQV